MTFILDEMTRMRRFATILLATAAVAASWGIPAVAQAEIFDQIVARVNDEIITQHELDEATTPYLLQRGMKPSVLEDEERKREIQKKVLENLIERQLLVEQAREMDLDVTDQQVDQWMAMTRQRQGMSEEKFRSMIEQYGMTYERYRQTIRQNLLKMRFVKMKLGNQVSVADEKVMETYREQYGPAGETERQIKVRQILIQPDGSSVEALNAARDKAEKVLKKLDNGGDFQKLAEKHSDGPSAKKGGLLGTFRRGELNDAFVDAVFALEEGQHSGVVETKHGFHILLADEISQAASQDVGKRKRRIRQKLRQQKLQDKLDVFVEKLRKKAFIDVKR